MLHRFHDDDGHPAYVRVIAVLLVISLAFGALVTAWALVLRPLLHWMLPALF